MNYQIKMDLKNKTYEELADLYYRAGIKEEEIIAEKIELRNELARRMKAEGLSDIDAGEYQVKRIQKLVFNNVSLEKAKEIGAIKIEQVERKDTKILRGLYNGGVKIEGAEIVQQIQVFQID